jgi:hypothetical protein|tara:strand:+ start:463 stop:1899 length:1437 start_codon:yes stop_codon:yes gene_type:complete
MRTKLNIIIQAASISSLCFFLGACVPGNIKLVADQHEQATLFGYDEAAALYRNKNGEPNYNSSDLYQLLLAGKSLHDAGYWNESNMAFQLAENQLLWKADKVDTANEALALVGTTLTNDAMSAYSGKIYEGVMVNYYQALNYLMLGDEDKALVRFNRLGERQSTASVQLRRYETALNNVKQESMNSNQTEVLGTSARQVRGEINSGLSGIPSSNKRSYIRNQSGDVLHAIFRSTNEKKGDDWQVPKLLQHARSNALDSDSRSLAVSIEDSLGHKNKKYTYVIYEDGTGPYVTENRIDLPIPSNGSEFIYFGVALPKFNKGQNSSYSFEVLGAKSRSVVTNINNMAGIEFQSSYNAKVDKALIAAFLKAIAQHEINKEFSDDDDPLVGILANVFTAVVAQELTKADVRAWTNLPNRIHMAVIQNENNSNVDIEIDDKNISVAINSNTNNIIYVRKARANGNVKAFVQTLPATSLARKIM